MNTENTTNSNSKHGDNSSMNNNKTATVNTWIHQNTVDTLKEIPITEVAEKFGLKLKKSGARFVTLCPFHKEKTPSFFLTNGKGFKCFGCGKSGDNIKLYQKLTGIENFRESVEGLAGMFNIPIEYDNPQQQQQQRIIPLAKPKLTIATFDNPPDNVEVKISKIADDITEVKTIYRYSETQRVERIERYDANNNRIKFTLPHREKPDHKHLFPYHVDDNGNTIKKKGDKPWDFYRQNEAVEFGRNKWALMVEGENCVEALRALGIVGLSRMGSDKREESVKRNFTALKNASVSGVVLIADNDRVGLEECKEFSEWASEVGLNTIVISTKDFWSEAPERGDIVDFIREHPETTQAELLKLLEGVIQSIQDAETSLRNSSKSTYQTSGTAALKPDIQSNVLPFQRQEPPKLPPIKEALNALLEQNLSNADLDNELLELSAIYPRYSKNDIEKLYRKLSEDTEQKDSQSDIKIELEELLKNRNQSLDLTQYLPGNLAKIGEFASRLCLRPELSLSAFLTVSSSLLAVGTTIDLLVDYCQFDQKSLGLYTAICAEPSQKKSPLINKIALEPLLRLQEEERQQFESQMDVFKLDHKLWKSNPESEEPEPETPVMRRYFINSGSQAGIRNVLNTHSKKGWGVLVLTDELAASYKNNGKTYNAGLLEDFLTYYDGYGKFEALKDGFAGDFSQCLVSMLGGIQPGVVSEYMNGNDTNGHWSRVNVVNQPVVPSLIPDNLPSKLEFKEMLVDFYRKLSQLPRLDLTLDAKARSRFILIYNKCELHRVEAKTQALASLWGKMPGKIGRFAALLHIIDQVWQFGTVRDLVVGKATLDKAAKLAKFYYQESYSMYADCSQEKSDLAPQLVKILGIAEKRQTAIGARDIKAFDRSFTASTPDDIRAMFTQLVELGYGEVEGSGTRLKFKIIQSVDNCRQTVDKTVDSETVATQGLQPTVDTVDKKNKNFQNEPINQLDEITHIDDVVQNPKESEKLSTVSTVPQNLDTVDDTASTEMSTECLQLSTECLDSSDRSPEPKTEPLDFDYMKEGDILFDTHGQPHKITGRTRQLWETHRKQYISRNDIITGQFHRATVEDITKLIKRTIKGKNKIQAQWLCDVYGGDTDSLMALAIDTNPEELALIFDFDGW